MAWSPKPLDRTYRIPDGTPLREFARVVVFRPLNVTQAYRVEVGAFGRFLTSLSPEEFDRYVETDLKTASSRAARRDPKQDAAEMAAARRADPSKTLDLRRACLYAVREMDGEPVRTPPGAFDDPDRECWLDDLPRAAVAQLGAVIAEDAGLLETEDEAGEGERGSTAP